MKIFVTGASGYIGNAVAKIFARSGHYVTGLVRSEIGAKELQRNEITPFTGTIFEFAAQAAGADAIVHCAFENPDLDKEAVSRLIDAKAKTFVYTSGVWVYGNRKETITEKSPLKPLDFVSWRPLVEQKALQNGAIVIRPAHVYGYQKGLIGMIFDAAAKGNLEISGNGENHWSLVHLEDLAHLYRLAVEKGLKKIILNGSEKKSIKIKDLAEAAARLAKTQVHYLSYEMALKKFGPLAEGLAIDQLQILSAESEHLLGWNPRHNDLLSRIEHYWLTFKAY